MKHHIKWWLEIIPDAKMKVIDIAATGNEVDLYELGAARQNARENFWRESNKSRVSYSVARIHFSR